MKSILVTGSHRSGTTFLGEMLSLKPSICSLFEPFNPQLGLEAITSWYKYLEPGMQEELRYRDEVSRLLQGRSHFKRIRRPSEPVWKKTARNVIGNTQNLQLLRVRLDPRVEYVLLKDPIAALASQWLHRTFGTQVVVLIRHPAAVVGSVLRLNWAQNPKEWFLGQRELVRRFQLGEFLSDPAAEGSLLERASVTWACLYRVLGEFLHENPGMVPLRHEDLSDQPVESIKGIYQQFGLHFDGQVARKIREYTANENPVDPTGNAAHVLKRDSRANASRWKKFLTPAQVEQVYKLTSSVAAKWYDGSDWGLPVG